ncbi:MAG: sugar-binding domain-containing protein, partial [Candidatus Hydrogenedentales bacterium]
MIAAIPVAADSVATRSTTSLDGAWSFRLDPDSAGESERWFQPEVTFADTIQVPGAWDAQGFGPETDKLRHNFIGKGWYARTVEVPNDWQGRRVFLCFGGVYRAAKVWINGTLAGEHLGYVSNFEYDITPYVQAGAPNRVVIQVDSEQRWEKDALQGCMDIIDHLFTYWGGIWSHVSLEARSAAWLEKPFIVPRTEPDTGCSVEGQISGDPAQASAVAVTVYDAEGTQVATQRVETTKEGSVHVSISLPDAHLWSPETPYLYAMEVVLLDAAGGELDRVRDRFGVRVIELRDTNFLVNGKVYYLAGYGDDCVYPKTIAPPADKQFYVERLRVAKSYGFNFVRHHSHFVAPEYYEACDEVGMFVSPELPIAYPRFYDRAQGSALELYKSEWTAAIKRYRNHPSIFDWCMANEQWEGMPRVAPDLYRIAKELDPTRPVIDSDGIFNSGFIDGSKDRPTLDFLPVMFDILTTPLDNPGKFATGKPLKPMITHEEGNYVHFPRLDEIEMYRENFKPFWLTDCRDRVSRAGLLDEAPAWSLASERLYLQCHKSNIEALRKNPSISGYHWWLLQPWYVGSNGLVHSHFRPLS